ncbi:MAG: MarR family transcriptional regulator [Acidobacteriota bacterium]|nr:MarR family transcriptional regulator [Acidobacteriota bacterium]
MTLSDTPATDRPTAEGAASDLADLVAQTARRIRRGSTEHLAPLGVTGAQARVLRTVSAGPIRMADIAARLEVVPRSVTSMVDGLEENGLVCRRPDPDDRRSVLVEPTAAGKGLLARLHQARHASAEQVFAPLDDLQRAELGRLLGRLCGGACHEVAGHRDADRKGGR